MKLNAVDYLTKPVEEEQLIKVIEKAEQLYQKEKKTEEILKEIRSVADVLKNPDVGYEEKGNLIRSVVEQIIYDKESGKMSFDIIIS